MVDKIWLIIKRNKIVASFLISSFLIISASNFMFRADQQFTYLSQAFLKGSTSFLQQPGSWYDTTVFEDRYYWPLGPFPAVVLFPFVFLFNLVNRIFYQGYLQFFLGLGVACLCYKIGRLLNYSVRDSLYWSLAFCFASMFIWVIYLPISWYFSHVVVVFLLFLLIYEFLTKKRPFVFGAIVGMAFASRMTAGLSAALFSFLVIFFITSKKRSLEVIKNLLYLSVLPLATFLTLAIYNFVRFGNFFEMGYSNQILFTDSLYKARSYGLYSLAHLPGNIYYSLLSVPVPVFRDDLSHVLKFPFITENLWGMSIFVTSPYLLYLFVLNYRDRLSRILWLVIGTTALSIYLYYGIGFKQYGYRYFLDFMPFLFFLLMRNYRLKDPALSVRFKGLIIASAIFNFYLILT